MPAWWSLLYLQCVAIIVVANDWWDPVMVGISAAYSPLILAVIAFDTWTTLLWGCVLVAAALWIGGTLALWGKRSVWYGGLAFVVLPPLAAWQSSVAYGAYVFERDVTALAKQIDPACFYLGNFRSIVKPQTISQGYHAVIQMKDGSWQAYSFYQNDFYPLTAEGTRRVDPSIYAENCLPFYTAP